MTQEELIDKIESLVVEYFEDNDEMVDEVYTIGYPGDDYKISLDFSFEKI